MRSLFDSHDRSAMTARLRALGPASARQWGKMEVAQMLHHCALTLEVPLGQRVKAQGLFGKLLAPFVRTKYLGEAPLSKNGPTDPDFAVTARKEFEPERARVVALVEQLGAAGAASADGKVHSFFGRLTGDEWGRLMWKHLDHHLRQFGS